MVFDAEILLARLAALTADKAASRFLVAFSGGIDSTVLLHALCSLRDRFASEVVALHVNHSTHPCAADWDQHCRQFAEQLGVSFASYQVVVDASTGQGYEAAARTARYTALKSAMNEGDCLLTAHHQDDQGETLLLNLMRGSGLQGLSGIAPVRNFGAGRLLRPLLDISADAVVAYANRHALEWIEDSSNTDIKFDRNYLRREIVPLLKHRWPAVSSRLQKSADLAREANLLLQVLADSDLKELGDPARIDVEKLMLLSPARQRNVLRRAVGCAGLPMCPATRLDQVMHELLPARPDAEPVVRWPGAEFRRYRGYLYLLPVLTDAPVVPTEPLKIGDAGLSLGSHMGCLYLQSANGSGIRASVAEAGLQVRYRKGGEQIVLPNRQCTHKLKKLLQEEGVVPWMRERLPLLYAGDDLVAVADLWLADEYLSNRGFSIEWQDRPAIY